MTYEELCKQVLKHSIFVDGVWLVPNDWFNRVSDAMNAMTGSHLQIPVASYEGKDYPVLIYEPT